MDSSLLLPTIDVAATSIHLKDLRERQGLSVSELQKLFNFTYPQAIYNWENPDDKTLPRLDNIVVLAKLYKITIDDLLIIKGKPTECLSVSEPRPPYGISEETISYIKQNASKRALSAIMRFYKIDF